MIMLLCATSPQGVEKVKEEQGGFAFMMEDAGIQYLVERNCELAQVSNSAWGCALRGIIGKLRALFPNLTWPSRVN